MKVSSGYGIPATCLILKCLPNSIHVGIAKVRPTPLSRTT